MLMQRCHRPRLELRPPRDHLTIPSAFTPFGRSSRRKLHRQKRSPAVFPIVAPCQFLISPPECGAVPQTLQASRRAAPQVRRKRARRKFQEIFAATRCMLRNGFQNCQRCFEIPEKDTSTTCDSLSAIASLAQPWREINGGRNTC